MSYYENDLPTINEIVFVKIYRITDEALYCRLIEYGGQEAVLPKTELDKKTYNSAERIFDDKKTYPMCVTSVDAVKKTVDLSYRKVKPCHRDDYLKKFDFVVKIYRLTTEIATLSGVSIDAVLPMTMWKVFQKDDLDNSKDIFYSILDNPKSYLQWLESDIVVSVSATDQREKIQCCCIKDGKNIIQNIESRITRTSTTVHQEFEFLVLCNNAIDTIKEILNYKTDNGVIEYVNAPKYRIVVEDKTEKLCKDRIQECIDIIKSRIGDKKINFSVGNYKIVKQCDVLYKFLEKVD